jgi:predicted phosphodiesterase
MCCATLRRAYNKGNFSRFSIYLDRHSQEDVQFFPALFLCGAKKVLSKSREGRKQAMKVAVFSDVHGNLIALEQFVQTTQDIVDAYLCLGDVVNYGPWNDQCLDIVRNLPGITFLEGNHERLFLGTEDLDQELPLVQDFFHHSKAFFSREDLIEDLPRQYHLGPFKCLHTVGDRSIYPDTSIDIVGNHMIGHTHHQFQIARSGFVLANPGSVGQNRKWIDMVDYLILNTESGKIRMCSVPYDIDMFISQLRKRNYPEHCIAYYANKSRKSE